MNTESISVDACAKVNLRLAVLAREESGYHSLETVFCGISLSDRIEIRPSGAGVELAVEGAVDTGPPEENLVLRAANLFFDASGIGPAVRILLRKRIPSAAGLGGGSSDAAATLRALNLLHEEPLSGSRILQLGARLGSDVPFFLTGTPLALAWSRGERLLELPPLPPRPVVIAHPGVAMPTPAAFKRLAELREGVHALEPAAISSDSFRSWESLAALAVNDFEFVAFERIPTLTNAMRALLDAGAEITLLAGSGASIFGVFPTDEQAADGEQILSKMGLATWRCETIGRWPEPRLGIDHEGLNR